MSVSIPEFWKLVIDSRLLSAAECQKLGEEFGYVKGAAKQGNTRTLAEWLISRNVMSRYQTKILLGGRPGPFVYEDYKLYDRIDQGPLAGMFRAVHGPTRHPVILHFLSGPVTQNLQLWNAAASRTQAQCALVHPHVVRCHELVILAAYKFVVLEGLQGETVDQVLAAAGGRFAMPEACRIARQASLGLAQLHQTGQVFGDVRPASLWMEPGGNVKLPHDPLRSPSPIDLKAFDPTGCLLARADYLAPELTQPGKSPDALTDVYGLGCTLYHMLSGRPPFPGGSVTQKMGRHATEAIEPLDQVSGIPQPVAQIVAYMMAKNPSVRYQSAADVASALGQFVDHSQVVPQPALAVPTLPAYENTINEKRATLAAKAAGVAGIVPQTSLPQVQEPFPEIQTHSGAPASSTSPGPIASGAGVGDREESQTTSASPAPEAGSSSEDPSGKPQQDQQQQPEGGRQGGRTALLTRRNILIAAAVALAVLLIVLLSTWGSCSWTDTPDTDQRADAGYGGAALC